MQLHVNDMPTSVTVEDLTHAMEKLLLWGKDWRTAEIWERGVCIVRAMRMPQTDDEMIVLCWTEFAPGRKLGHVEILNVSDGCTCNEWIDEVF